MTLHPSTTELDKAAQEKLLATPADSVPGGHPASYLHHTSERIAAGTSYDSNVADVNAADKYQWGGTVTTASGSTMLVPVRTEAAGVGGSGAPPGGTAGAGAGAGAAHMHGGVGAAKPKPLMVTTTKDGAVRAYTPEPTPESDYVPVDAIPLIPIRPIKRKGRHVVLARPVMPRTMARDRTGKLAKIPATRLLPERVVKARQRENTRKNRRLSHGSVTYAARGGKRTREERAALLASLEPESSSGSDSESDAQLEADEDASGSESGSGSGSESGSDDSSDSEDSTEGGASTAALKAKMDRQEEQENPKVFNQVEDGVDRLSLSQYR